jgi:hypothetical protein
MITRQIMIAKISEQAHSGWNGETTMDKMRLFSYKMTHDSGFAPNPFGGFLTLATCKPLIRKHKRPGDWIAGFTSKQLNGDAIGNEKLIYLMKIEKIIPFSEYWKDPEYEVKKMRTNSKIGKRGDNIYTPIIEKPITASDFEQTQGAYHTEKDKLKDLSGERVLVSRTFFYFGSKPIVIPENIKPNIPKGQSSQGAQTHDIKKAKEFIAYIESEYKCGLSYYPHNEWDKDDSTWKDDESYIKP